MERDVKDFLYAWCTKRKLHAPVYQQIQKGTGGKKGASVQFVAEAKIKNFEKIVGTATDFKIRTAKTAAALDLCNRLVEAGIMGQEEFTTRVPASSKVLLRTTMKRKAPDPVVCDECPGASNGVTLSENDGPKKKIRLSSDSVPNLNGAETENENDVEIIEEIGLSREERELLMAQLHTDIMEHYYRNRQPSGIFQWKMRVLNNLAAFIKPMFRYFHIFPTGSTVNGLGSYNSDMDICLVIFDIGRRGEMLFDDSRFYAFKVLRRVSWALSRMSNIRNIQFISAATVPIIRLEYFDAQSSVEIDINCNNLPGVRNSHLLHYYASLDERFPALSLLVKHWAIVNDINDACAGTLSSYALTLMVIHYLQYGVILIYPDTKAVLPNLHKLLPDLFNSNTDVRYLELFRQLPIPPNDTSGRRLTSAELLLGFFQYYSNHFDYDNSAGSVRVGGIMDKEALTVNASRPQLLCMEEPYENTNVARAVTKDSNFCKIIKAFKLANRVLRRFLTLDSIGVKLEK